MWIECKIFESMGITISLLNGLFWRLSCAWRTLSVLTGTDNRAFSACEGVSSCSKGVIDLIDQSQGPELTLGGS